MDNKKKIALGTLVIGAIGTGVYLLNSQKNVKFKTVNHFKLEDFFGRWYEIARIDFKYEKGMTNCLAKYKKEDDGSISVINSGYDKKKKRWKKSEGTLKAIDEEKGQFRVSFGNLFYSPYNVLDIDDRYENVLVAGKNHDYLWILSREKEISDKTKSRFLAKAIDSGYDITRLTWTSQIPIDL